MGARRIDVVGLVLRQGTGYALAGLVFGVGGALAFMRLLAALVPGAASQDMVILGEVAALLLAVALAASYIPARRGARVDPVVALKCE